jgi:hypothetical protein
VGRKPGATLHAVLAGLVVAGLAACSADREDKRLLHASEPYVGLACPTPAYPCERVGVGVVVMDRVKQVTATVEGRTVTLREPEEGGNPERPLGWEGFFRWPGAQERANDTSAELITVRLRAVALDGSRLETTKRVPLQRGYG